MAYMRVRLGKVLPLCRCDTTVHLSHAFTRFLGDVLYDAFVSSNILIKAVRRLFRLSYWSLAAHVHCSVRFLVLRTL